MARFLFTVILCSLFHTIAFLKFSVGIDTLCPNQTIAIGQTLISRSGVFEMGFFSPGKSPNRFLGIWYKSTPEVVVWVANRNNPITGSQGVRFMISRNGSLVISGGGSVIWSEDLSSELVSNPVLQLLDSGNLVLVNETKEVPSQSYIWQSFDYPTDTTLTGAKMVDDIDAGVEKYLTSWRSPDDPSPGDFVHRIENKGLPQMVTLRGKRKIFRSGKWNGLYFNGFPHFPNALFKPKFVFKGERLVSASRPYESSVYTRATLDPSGSIQCYTMNARNDKWSLVYTFPSDQCDHYGVCGPNSVCRIDKPTRCECLEGYAPNVQKDWDVQDWSGGCTRIAPLNCEGGDGFLEVRSIKYPDMLTFWMNASMSLDECKVKCLKNCNCTAYANPYTTNGGSGCMMWFGDLVDTRQIAAADSKQNIYIRLPVSELDPSSSLEKKEKKNSMMLILLSIASGVLVSGFINGSIYLMARKKSREKKHVDLELPLFKMAAIVAATNNFSRENMIGQGGFGVVYKGMLSAKEEIAVKRLSRTSGQGLEEFTNEIISIAKLQHKNLVKLLGCCIEGEERILIYEYMQNKSLDYFVFDEIRKVLLTWPMRFDIIMGIARGLLYLHHDSRLRVIHRDFKTSNILLDGNFNPKISDFGLARIFEEDQSIARTQRVIGSHGYMAPEYVIDGKFSEKSDVFSLGVVLLEIISGKKNRGFEHSDHYHSLLGHAWLLWKENKILELMDECLDDTFVKSQVKKCIQVGLLCVQKFAEERPMMSSVLFMLGTDGAILPEPKEPGFFIERSCSPASSCRSPSIRSENTVTMTDLEAR